MKSTIKYYVNKVSKASLLGETNVNISPAAARTNAIPKATQLKQRLSLSKLAPIIVVVEDEKGKEISRDIYSPENITTNH